MLATRRNAERRQYWDPLVPVNGPKLKLGEEGEHANVFSQRGLSVGGDKLNPLVDTRASCARSLTRKLLILLGLDGRGERIRTSDPLVPNQVLYQAEPLPELAVGRTFTDRKAPG